jgi:hypothetical protein
MKPGEWDPVQRMELAERVRAACIQAAIEAYEDAGVRGPSCQAAGLRRATGKSP